MIRIGWVLLGACLLVLGGCAAASRQAPFPSHYVLTGAAVPATPAPAPVGQRGTLRVARISAPPWLDGTDLYYRLAWRHDHAIAAYADSDWVSPPARMLGQVIVNALAGAALWRIVLGPDSPAQVALGLDIRLDDFSQVFTSPGASVGVLDATATLVDNRDGRVIAQRRFQVKASAPSADAAGGVEALNDASRQFATQLVDWLRDAAPARPSANGATLNP